ncbi:MAG: nicotinate-nucleotide diphosphorylase (carboxylating), partial [bacterium]
MSDDIANEAATLIRLALQEDLEEIGDITTDALGAQGLSGEAFIVAKQPGVLAGLKVAEAVFKKVNPEIELMGDFKDGDRVEISSQVCRITGPLT